MHFATQNLKLNYAFLFCFSFVISIVVVFGCQDDGLNKIEKLIEEEKLETAVNKLETIIDKKPNNPEARMLLGRVYNQLNRSDDAILQFKRTSQLYTSQPDKRLEARLELARTYLRIGNRRSAFRLLNTIHKGTSDPEVLREIISFVGDSYKTKQLTNGESDNYSPTFSLDGTQIAFSSFRLDNDDIYLMDISGRILRRVTYTTDFNDSAPTFLKNPNFLLYSSESKSSREVKVGILGSGSTSTYAGLNMTHIHSKVTRAVIPISFGTRAPRSSPSGMKVVYESSTDDNLELYLLDFKDIELTGILPQQTTPERITFNDVDDGSPTFFPDEERLVFVSSHNGVNQLFTIDIDGKNLKHLNPNRYGCYNPTVSPDGKTIAFMSSRDNDWEIYLVDVDGKNERKITSGIGRSIQPTFSPDGRYLAFASDRNDSFHIYLMDLSVPTTCKDLVKLLEQ